jgi:photosystem II stability/assembly factor-like uncharacterized protein
VQPFEDAMGRYKHVVDILDQAIGGPGANIGVHGAFWRGVSRDEFVAKNVLGLPLVVVGNGAGSNLVKALRGQSPFGADLNPPPPDAQFDRMPSGFDPVATADIDFIQAWIDDGCPAEAAPPAPAGGPAADEPTTGLRWRPTNAPLASSRTDDIWFIDRTTGWAVNSNGQIVKTTDGFKTFVEQLHDPTLYFRCIGFASATRGWAGTLTPPKILFDTKDGGTTWSPVTNLPGDAPGAVCGLSVVSEQVVFMSGTNFPNRPPRMMKTVDGGASWTAWEMSPWASILIDTFFLNERQGWVVGGKAVQQPATRNNVKAVVLRTDDGGKTWDNRIANLTDQLPQGEWGWKIQFISDKVGFVSLENFAAGAILKTTDGGLSWTRIAIDDPQKNANLEGVGFIDESHGWVGGWGDAQFKRLSSSETLDGGKTWRDANEIGKALNRFRFFGSPVTLGYASGQTVYRYSSEVPAAGQAVGPRRTILSEPFIEVMGKLRLAAIVPRGAHRLTVRIWDRFGELVATPVDEDEPAPGPRLVAWDDGPRGQFIVRATVDRVSESSIVHVA